ncbi:synaptonemal complex protein 3-like [Dipodomys merriami]|uniref:synaptonemal complex protein 3-like n=1 Tax=Dipodomys merriami TaxID=94247 RepID=UPI003855F841
MAHKPSKHQKEESKVSESVQHMASCSPQNPANNPAFQSCGDFDSFFTPEDELRIELKNMFVKFQEDIRKKLLTKRSLKMKVSATFKNIQKKWDHMLQGQHERRMNLFGKDTQEMVTVLLLSKMRLNDMKEEGENLATLYQKQEDTFQQSIRVHIQKIEALEKVYDQNFKETFFACLTDYMSMELGEETSTTLEANDDK